MLEETKILQNMIFFFNSSYSICKMHRCLSGEPPILLGEIDSLSISSLIIAVVGNSLFFSSFIDGHCDSYLHIWFLILCLIHW